MPRRYPNPYRDYTGVADGITAGINNLSMALLAQPELESKRALNQAHQEAYLASAQNQAALAGLNKAKASEQSQQVDTRQNYALKMAQALLGEQAGSQALRHIRGEKDTLPAYEDEQRQMTMAPRQVPVAAPDTLSPQVRRDIENAARIAVMLQAGGGNVEQAAKATSMVGDDALRADMIQKRIDPTTYMQALGKQVFAVDGDTVINKATGDLGKTTELGKSRIATEGTKQQENRAQAGAASRSNQLVEVPNPLDGGKTKIKIPASTFYAQEQANYRADENNAAKVDIANSKTGSKTQGSTAKAPSDKDIKDIEAQAEVAIRDELGLEDATVDPGLKQKIAARAAALFIDSESGAYRNRIEAARMAAKELRGGTETSGWFSKTIRAKGGEQTKPTAPQSPSMDEWMKAARKANPKATDQELRDYYKQKYEGA